DDVRLERREVVRQPGEAGRQEDGVFQLRGEELDGVGQPGGGEHLFVDALEDLLGGDVLRQALAEDAEQVRLFDVLFPVEGARRGHGAIITRTTPGGASCQ